MIKITPDRRRRYVNVMMSGFLDVADVRQFTADKEAAVEAMGLKSGEFVLLIDTAGSTIQSQEVVAALMDAAINTRYRSRKLAVVRRDHLTRMQSRRILSVRDDACLFGTREEAEAWLFEGPEQTAP